MLAFFTWSKVKAVEKFTSKSGKTVEKKKKTTYIFFLFPSQKIDCGKRT